MAESRGGPSDGPGATEPASQHHPLSVSTRPHNQNAFPSDLQDVSRLTCSSRYGAENTRCSRGSQPRSGAPGSTWSASSFTPLVLFNLTITILKTRKRRLESLREAQRDDIPDLLFRRRGRQAAQRGLTLLHTGTRVFLQDMLESLHWGLGPGSFPSRSPALQTPVLRARGSAR